MNTYMFRQRCRPRGDLRVKEIIRFLELVEETFKCMSLYDRRSQPLVLTTSEIGRILEKRIDKVLPSVGATEDFYTIPPAKRDDDTIAIEIHTGTQPDQPLVDSYNLNIGESWKVPNLFYFERSIEIFRPFEAFLAENKNETALDAHGILQETGFKRPQIIRGFHYLDAEMARSIGGIEYCLEAPAWRVERFCDGVLIQLIPVLFDSTNSRHLQVQKDVMRYFDLS